MATFLVYALTDPRDGSTRYIGKSESGLARPREHSSPSALRHDGDTYKTRWIKKLLGMGKAYGIAVMYAAETKAGLDDAERFWIAEMRRRGHRLTNLTEGGTGGKPTEETRLKLSAAKKGRPASNRGKTYSPEVRARMGAGNRGRKATDAARLKRSRPFADENGNRFVALSDAARFHGVSRTLISEALRGLSSSARGHTFRYAE